MMHAAWMMSVALRGDRFRSRHGFTLVELLVVASILVLLVALLMPALQEARNMAQVTGCASNQRQIYMATVNYASEFHRKMPVTMTRQGIGLHRITVGGYWSGIDGSIFFTGPGMLWAHDYLPNDRVLLDPGFQPPDNRRNKSYRTRRLIIDTRTGEFRDDWHEGKPMGSTYPFYGYRKNKNVGSGGGGLTDYEYRKLGQKAVPRFMGDVPKWRIISPITMCLYGGRRNPQMAGHADHDTINVLYIGGSVQTHDGVRDLDQRAQKFPRGNSGDCAWWFGSERNPHNWWEWATHKGEG